MNRIMALIVLLALGGCAFEPYEADPVSGEQWRRRQEAIERREAERQRLCRITRDEDPRKEELCRGVERKS